MKRMLLMIAALAFALTGCAGMGPAKENAATPTTDAKKILVAQVNGDPLELSAEHSETIRQFLCDDDWTPDTAKCESDYIVTFDGRTIFYHSECGTLNERASNRSFCLSETDRETVNSIIRSVFYLD